MYNVSLVPDTLHLYLQPHGEVQFARRSACGSRTLVLVSRRMAEALIECKQYTTYVYSKPNAAVTSRAALAVGRWWVVRVARRRSV